MPPEDALQSTLAAIDGRGYGSYKRITGRHDLGDLQLVIDQVQVDPYAPPSKARAVLDRETAALPPDLVDTEAKRVAVGDFLTRAFHREAKRLGSTAGRSGSPIGIGSLGQQVLPRTAMAITGGGLEARFTVELPARGRTVLGRAADRLLTETVPQIVDSALRGENLDRSALRAHVELYLDQQHLRAQLAARRLVAFVGDGAVLPRASGDSDHPLTDGAQPFSAPASMRVSCDLPSGRTVTGMGIGEGVTVIVGGGYHGKSTLLRAVERGVYPHVSGDGREWVITREDAVTIRAEDGRAVTDVDISPFISGLPSGSDTARFTTSNGSGSTSQAANLVEAVDAGASLLLIDEDTSATNFMIRDERMRTLIPAEREPITPFVDRVRPLHNDLGVSTILVAGGSGAFFDVADRVIALDAYVPQDATERAREVARRLPAASDQQPTGSPPRLIGSAARVPTPRSLNPRGKTKPAKARGRTTVLYGPHQAIDLSAVSQLVDPGQTTAVARALDALAAAADGERSVRELIDDLFRQVERRGLDSLSPHEGHPGLYALPRPYEVHAALNRYRGLEHRPAG